MRVALLISEIATVVTGTLWILHGETDKATRCFAIACWTHLWRREHYPDERS